MIAYLKGTVTEVDKDSIILECRNIGYRIFMPGSVLERMGRTGEESTNKTNEACHTCPPADRISKNPDNN